MTRRSNPPIASHTPRHGVPYPEGALLARYVPDMRIVPAVPLEKLSKCEEAVRIYAEDPMLKAGFVG